MKVLHHLPVNLSCNVLPVHHDDVSHILAAMSLRIVPADGLNKTHDKLPALLVVDDGLSSQDFDDAVDRALSDKGYFARSIPLRIPCVH